MSFYILEVEKILKDCAYQIPMPTGYWHLHRKNITKFIAKKTAGHYHVFIEEDNFLVAINLLHDDRHNQTQFIDPSNSGMGKCILSFIGSFVHEVEDKKREMGNSWMQKCTLLFTTLLGSFSNKHAQNKHMCMCYI